MRPLGAGPSGSAACPSHGHIHTTSDRAANTSITVPSAWRRRGVKPLVGSAARAQPAWLSNAVPGDFLFLSASALSCFLVLRLVLTPFVPHYSLDPFSVYSRNPLR